MNKILQMLQLQQQLNDNTNGKGWEAGITKNGKIINWRRCIFLECAELIDSYPWKHWKGIDQMPNYDNIKIEAVDIWHFVMSEAIVSNSVQNQGSLESLSSMITAIENFESFTTPSTSISTSKDSYAHIETIEAFIRTTMLEDSIALLLYNYFEVAKQSGLNLTTLYALYIGKNTLNQFRQDHGYKEGSYIKIWNGKEDNEVMQMILHEESSITPDELYKRLEGHYRAL
jgi:dimeric dUTPase (all-alpha-NTP-PPase superfamily)